MYFKSFQLSLLFLLLTSVSVYGQLSDQRLAELADMKVERFQNILDLSPAQSTQLRKETISLMKAQGRVADSQHITKQIQINLDNYYASLTSLKPQQLATLKVMDSLDRQSRRSSYQDLLKAYGESTDFAVEVAAYNWNVITPLLVSYRRDLDRYIDASDRLFLDGIRDQLISKYNFITAMRAQKASVETEAIISTVQEDLISDISESGVLRLLQKYDDHIAAVRGDLAKYEKQIAKDIASIYEVHMLDNHKEQLSEQKEVLDMLGISQLMRNAFFLLMDPSSRSASFKINALHLMAYQLQVTDQF